MKVQTWWEEYAAAVLPADCSEAQRTETRRAFYAGCYSMPMGFSQIGDAANAFDRVGIPADATEDAGAQVLEDLKQEIEEFYREVKAGRA